MIRSQHVTLPEYHFFISPGIQSFDPVAYLHTHMPFLTMYRTLASVVYREFCLPDVLVP